MSNLRGTQAWFSKVTSQVKSFPLFLLRNLRPTFRQRIVAPLLISPITSLKTVYLVARLKGMQQQGLFMKNQI